MDDQALLESCHSFDPTFEAACRMEAVERRGITVPYGVEDVMDSTARLDWPSVIPTWHEQWASYNKTRCREWRAGRLKRRPGRRRYLQRIACAGCGAVFAPRLAASRYCGKACFDAHQALSLEIDGERLPVKAWAERSGTSVPAIKGRLKRGRPVREAVFGRQ